MERIATLYSRIQDYWHRDTEYVPLNFTLIDQCDWNAAKLKWLLYPSQLTWAQITWCSVHKSLKDLEDWGKTHQRDESVKVCSAKYFTVPFSSEKALVLDLLGVGLTIRL